MNIVKHPVFIFLAGVIVGTYFGAKIKSGVSSTAAKLA